MAKDIIGLDISDASIEAIVLEKTKAGFAVSAYSRYRLSPEIVSNGRVLQPAKLKEALQLTFQNAQPRPIEAARVYLSLPESRAFTKVFSLPKNLSDKELATAAQHKAEEMIPEAMEQLLTAKQLLASKNEHKEVLFVAVDKETANGFSDVFKELNIEIVGMTTESISAWSGLHEKFRNNLTLLLDLGSRTTIASIYDNNGVRDSININIAGDNIVRALIARFNIDYVKAEEKIRDIGLTATEGDGEVMLLIQGQLQPLTDEVRRFIDFYQEANQIKIEQIVLIGGLAQMRGIVNYFGANLNLPAFIGETFLANPSSGQVAFTKYINALGLARLIYNKTEINFYNESNKKLLGLEPSKIEAAPPEMAARQVVENKKNIISKFQPGLKFRQIFSSLYFALFIMLLGLVGTVIAFRQPLQQILVGNKSYTISGQMVFVGQKNPGQMKNFVYGQPASFTLNQEKDHKDLPYQEAQNKIVSDLHDEVLRELNKKYQQTGFYIVPQIVDTQIISSSPKEADFKPGQPLAVQVTFSFIAITDEEVKRVALQQLPDNQGQNMLSWQVVSAEYKTVNWDAGNKIIGIEVNMKLKSQ